MSEYNKFVKLHFASAPGNSSQEKIKNIAAMWRQYKETNCIKSCSHKKGGATVLLQEAFLMTWVVCLNFHV